MSTEVSFILVSMFGAFCQEVVHWFELRNKVRTSQFKKLLHSAFYWIITILMILVSGIGTWLLFSKEIPDQRNIQFILGAAFPVIFKKLVKAYESRDLVGDESKSSIKKLSIDVNEKLTQKQALKLYFQ